MHQQFLNTNFFVQQSIFEYKILCLCIIPKTRTDILLSFFVMLQWKTTELFWTINRQENWEFEQRVFPFRFDFTQPHLYC